MDKWVNNVFLGLGSNIGDRSKMLEEAVLLLETNVGQIVKQSSVYETQAWGNNELNVFYNQVVVLRTQLSPFELLEQCLSIEKYLGRISRISDSYENRLIDIDLLFYDQFFCEEKQLVLPHPYICQRNFVLVPLLEVAPNFVHPKLGLNIREILHQSKDKIPVKQLNR